MLNMVRAHGLDPGPTQRPALAGLLAGLAGAAPALAIWEEFGWLDALAGAGAARLLAALAGAAALSAAGGLYGLAFGRGANDPLGGWLFGLAFGFLLWMLVPVLLLQWLPAVSQEGRPAFVGRPAMGLLLGALAWGAMLGALFPALHRWLRAGLDDGAAADGGGPDAAAMPELGRNPRNGGQG